MDDDVSPALSCPVCASPMDERTVGNGGTVSVCPDAHGVFLRRADLGALVESEGDWHRHAGQHTMPMPRITTDMSVPPASRASAQAWVETLFD